MYCIESGSQQQCGNCQLIDGKLYTNGGHPFPNCDGTQWVQVSSMPGTNNTPVYQVVNTPIDSILYIAIGLGVLLFKFRNRIYERLHY